MVEAARQGTENSGAEKASAEFICADAETYAFSEGRYDMLVSRFGIMFFEDPVKAFQNLRRAAARDARGLFVAWRSSQENPFMTAAARAAKSMVALPQQTPDAPGQFAFAGAKRVARILDLAGWRHISIEPLDFECAFPENAM